MRVEFGDADKDMVAMASEDVTCLESELSQLDEEIMELLVPIEPESDMDIMLEVRRWPSVFYLCKIRHTGTQFAAFFIISTQAHSTKLRMYCDKINALCVYVFIHNTMNTGIHSILCSSKEANPPNDFVSSTC